MKQETVQARRCLRGRYGTAAAIEGGYVAARAVFLLLELWLPILLAWPAAEWSLAGWRRTGALPLLLPLAIRVAEWLLLTPLWVGMRQYYLALRRQSGPVSWRVVLSGFRPGLYGAGLRLYLLRDGMRLLTGGVCLLPAAGMFAFAGHLARLPAVTPSHEVVRWLCLLCGVIFAAAGLLFSRILLVRYWAAPYLLPQKPGALRALRASRRMMRGHGTETVQLYARALLPFAASVAVLPYFWVAAWFHTVCAGAFYRYFGDASDR